MPSTRFREAVLHYTVKDLIGLGTGQDLYHLIVHTQQQGYLLAYTAAVQEDKAEAAEGVPMAYSVPATVTELGALAEGATAVIRPAALRL